MNTECNTTKRDKSKQFHPLKTHEVMFNQTLNIENHDFKIPRINHHLQIPEGHLYFLNRKVKVGGAAKPLDIPNAY
jgi:hypothetical protein